MNRKLTLSVLFFAWTVVNSVTLPAQTMFQKNFGSSNSENVIITRQTADGGYLAAGNYRAIGSNYSDYYLAKMDSLSVTSWAKTYGSADVEFLYAAIQTADGGYMMAGQTRITPANYDMLFIKTDANGDTIFTRTHGGDGATAIIQTADGGYLAGGSYTNIPNGTGLCLLKMDGSGNEVWSEVLNVPGINNIESARDIAQTSDGGYIITGDYAVGFWADCYLLKISSTGVVEWHQTYGGAFNDYAASVQQTADGGYILGGNSVIFSGANQANLFLVRTNSLGDTLWTGAYGGQGLDDFGVAQQTPDGGFIIGGSTENFMVAGSLGGYLVKTNASGAVSWSKTYGGNSFDQFDYVSTTADGGFIAGGYAGSFAGGYNYVVKTDSTGNSNCSQNAVTTIVYSQPIAVGTNTFSVFTLPSLYANIPITTGVVGGTSNTICFTTTAIHETDKNETEVSVYPNPASTTVLIKYNSELTPVDAIIITDAQGRMIQSVFSKPTLSFNKNIDITGLEKGIYFINIKSQNQMVNTTSLIKAD